MGAVQVKATDAKPGDKFVGWGPGWVVQGCRFVGMGDIGSEVERQRYVVTIAHEDGRTRDLPAIGDSKITISVPGVA